MMPFIKYEDINFSPWKLAIIQTANTIVEEYRQQGFTMTLRQLYYQFVARDLLPAKWADKATGSTNNQGSYKKLGKILCEGRKGGKVDWMAMIDRTREAGGNSHWEDPESIIDAVAKQFQLDKWADQPYRPQVWVEKDAQEGLVESVCTTLDVPFFSCRGYNGSGAAAWVNGQRLKDQAEEGAIPVVLHLGDHDPSGIDMSRDLERWARKFMGGVGDSLIFERIGLNFDQVQRYQPPNNFAKVTDSRFRKYRDRFGDNCWELDALEPTVIADLIRDRVDHYRDDDKFAALKAKEEIHRLLLRRTSDRWSDVVKLVG